MIKIDDSVKKMLVDKIVDDLDPTIRQMVEKIETDKKEQNDEQNADIRN